MIFFLLLLFSNLSFAEPKLALVYNGAGACDGCGETLGGMLQEMHFEIKYVGGIDPVTHSRVGLREEDFAQAALFVQPGGSDRIQDTLESLAPGELTNIRNFVFHGGKYLGTCAGAYLAAKKAFDEGKWIDAYGLVEARIDDEDRHRAIQNNAPRLEPIRWFSPIGTIERWMYFQEGPSLNAEQIKGAEIFATYEITGDTAALIAPSKQGFVGLVGRLVG